MTFKFKAVMVTAILFLGGVFARDSYAVSTMPGYLDSAAKALYGSSAGYNFSCTACHGTSGYSLSTTFGVQFKAKISSLYPGSSVGNLNASQVQNIIKNMETVDSDGDGADNKSEFLANTNPGDPASKPVVAVCTRSSPTVSVSPASQSGLAGASLNYSVVVKNNDSTNCQGSTFNVAGQAPSGLTPTLTPSSVVLSPGASATIAVKISSSASLVAGSYSVPVSLSDSAVSGHTGQTTLTYIVQAAATCTRAAPRLTLSPTSQTKTAGDSATYQLSVTNLDSSVCAASTFALAFSGDAALTGSLNLASVNLSPGQSGSASVTVSTVAGTAAAAYNFTLTARDSSASGQLIISEASGGSDVTPPSAPTRVFAKVMFGRVVLAWTRSTDNVGVVKYLIVVDGTVFAESTRTVQLLKLDPGSHTVSIRALDAAGNQSMDSSPVQVEIRAKGNHGDDDHGEDDHSHNGGRH